MTNLHSPSFGVSVLDNPKPCLFVTCFVALATFDLSFTAEVYQIVHQICHNMVAVPARIQELTLSSAT
ncbi:Hypothetical predicted protein [Podarcis lilfordi]|uniref:Uncharacterized protein n=1 Tax=Podarcis lilfordi TaxID=74358 RepID=A0AA35L2H2_9SAUR|nr:Hypothetical predicted protein [Podarcis lilfordi]